MLPFSVITNVGKIIGTDCCGDNNFMIIKRENIRQFIDSNNHTVILKHNGEVLVKEKDQAEFVLIMQDPDIKMISCDLYHTYILKNNGDTYFKKNYQCVHNQFDIYTHFLVKCNIIHITNSTTNFCIMVESSDTKTSKPNHHEVTTNHNKAISNIGLFLSILLESDFFSSQKKIKQIAAGDRHQIILMNNGEVYGRGSNSYGQLGLGSVQIELNQPQLLMCDKGIYQIACSNTYSVFLKLNGEVIFFGNPQCRDYCKSTIITKDETIIGIKCRENEIYFLKNNGDLTSCGYNSHCEPKLLMNNVAMIPGYFPKRIWSIHNHQYHGDLFKERIFTLLLCLRQIRERTGMKIYRFVLYEIIKMAL